MVILQLKFIIHYYLFVSLGSTRERIYGDIGHPARGLRRQIKGGGGPVAAGAAHADVVGFRVIGPFY